MAAHNCCAEEFLGDALRPFKRTTGLVDEADHSMPRVYLPAVALVNRHKPMDMISISPDTGVPFGGCIMTEGRELGWYKRKSIPQVLI